MFCFLQQTYYGHCFSDERFIKRNFRQKLNREVGLENPIKYNDKLQWLKLNWYDPLAARCADKCEVRKYVEERIGAGYLNEQYAVFESVEDIDIGTLPNAFVLKITHGSGYNIICKDKTRMNWLQEFKRMINWLRINPFLHPREWVYIDLVPRIVCEKYLHDTDLDRVRDYKVYCFDGDRKIIEVDFDRFVDHKRNFYDLDWKFRDVEVKFRNDPNEIIKKPQNLDKIIELSRKLSVGFPHVRVDFYLDGDKVVFGELTFFHASGTGYFKPEEFEIEMENWLRLPAANPDLRLTKNG